MSQTILNKTVFALLSVLAFSASVRADSIAVPDADFETMVLNPGANSGYFGPNGMGAWTPAYDSNNAQITGLQDIRGNNYYSSAVDGNNIAYTNSPNPFYQVLNAPIQDGTYTITVDVGYRNVFDGGSVGIYAGTPDLKLGDNIGIQSVTQPGQVGVMQEETFTFNVGTDSPYLGSPLVIGFSGNVAGDSTDFDNVRVDYEVTGAPEPATWALMLGGCALLLAGTRWLRRGSMGL